LLQLSVADLLVDGDQFLYQLSKTPIFGDLRAGAIHRRSLRDDLRNGLSLVGMRQGVGRAVSRGVFLCTVAVRLTTLAESGGERATTEIVDLSQTGLELLAFFLERF
jgi:hypothetical protein